MSEDNIKAAPGVFALGAIVLLGVMSASEPVSLVLHYFLGKFFYSTSNGAIYFFLVLLVLSCLFLLLTKRLRDTSNYKMILLLPAALLAGNLVNLLTLLIYSIKNQIPLITHFYHWLGQEHSFSYLFHNHTGKTALATIASLLSVEGRTGGFDLGQVFITHVPAGLTLILVILLLLSLGLFFPGLLTVRERFSGNYWLLLLYFFAFAGCFKTMVDGGPLTYRFLPSFFVLLSLVVTRDQADLTRLWRGWFGVLCVLLHLPLIFAWLKMSSGSAMTVLAPLVFLCGSYLLLFLLALPRRTTWIRISTGGILIYLTLSLTVEYVSINDDYFKVLGPEHLVVKVDFDNFTASEVSDEVRGMLVYQAYRRFQNDPLKPSSLFIHDRQEEGFHQMDLIVTPLQYRGLSGVMPSQGLLRFDVPKSLQRPANSLFFSLEAAVNLPPIFSSSHATLFSRNNYYCYLHLLGRLFNAAGMKEFVLMPITGG
jgi:hypothetical protein